MTKDEWKRAERATEIALWDEQPHLWRRDYDLPQFRRWQEFVAITDQGFDIRRIVFARQLVESGKLDG